MFQTTLICCWTKYIKRGLKVDFAFFHRQLLYVVWRITIKLLNVAFLHCIYMPSEILHMTDKLSNIQKYEGSMALIRLILYKCRLKGRKINQTTQTQNRPKYVVWRVSSDDINGIVSLSNWSLLLINFAVQTKQCWGKHFHLEAHLRKILFLISISI